MTSRREFLRQSSTAALSTMLLPALGKTPFLKASATKWPVGLQLYTMGKLMQTEPKATLEKIAAIGYQEIESAGLYGYTPKELAKLIIGLGMHWRSMHVGGAPITKADIYKMAQPKTAQDSLRIEGYARQLEKGPAMLSLKNDAQKLVDQAAEGGVTYLVCAAIPVASLDQMKTAVEVFNKTGAACKKAGIQFVYHNHATEFDTVEGHRPFDFILDNTDKELVKMELDLAWATKAGQDIEQLFKRHPGRYPLWHVKDIKADKNTITEVGNGMVDFKHIFPLAKLAGLKYFFVEQDEAVDPLKSVSTSYTNLKQVLA